MFRRLIPVALPLLIAAAPFADDAFKAGPVFTDFGAVAAVDSDLPVPKGTVFKVLFDASAGAGPGQINRVFDSAARFVNMHVAAGVPIENIHVAILVHGKASLDVLNADASPRLAEGKVNSSAHAVAQLLAHGIDIYLCGQSAAHFGIAKGDLIPGVKMSLSAMTASALLQQQGYVPMP